MGNYLGKQWPLPPSHVRPSSVTLTSRLWNPHNCISCHFCAWGQLVAWASASSSPTLPPLDLFVLGMRTWYSREIPSCQWSSQPAQDEPPLPAELGLILCTSGIKATWTPPWPRALEQVGSRLEWGWAPGSLPPCSDMAKAILCKACTDLTTTTNRKNLEAFCTH